MSFNILPSELIYNISYRIPPDTIEAYGRTCHRIRNVALPLIKEHRELIAQYTRCRVDKDTASDLLRAICVRPWIRFYPISLELKAQRSRSVANPLPTFQKIDYLGEAIMNTSIRDDIQKKGLVRLHEMDEWIERLNQEEEDDLFALLLIILPKLRSLRIQLNRDKLERVKEILRRIQKHSGASRALSKLKRVYIFEKNPRGPGDLELFPLAATLPAVEQIHGCNLIGMYRDCYQDWMTYPGASSSLTHISLETCGMSVEGLETLMKTCKNLQSFKYIAHHPGWGLKNLVDMLKNARATLHTLEISAGGGSARYVGTLKPFSALKNLTLDTDMVIRMGKIQRAVDLLPKYIERVTLCGNNLTEPLEQEFLAELYRPAHLYPNLKSIGVDDSFGRREIGKDRLQFQREFQRQTASTWMRRYG